MIHLLLFNKASGSSLGFHLGLERRGLGLGPVQLHLLPMNCRFGIGQSLAQRAGFALRLTSRVLATLAV